MSEPFSITIHSSTGEYKVSVARGLGTRGAGHAIRLADRRVADLHPAIRSTEMIGIDALETEKTLSAVEACISALRDQRANRSTRISVFGGGIIQDVATLTASLYMRGIAWDYYPTTLLSMVDSCIGGKSSINVGSYKNLAGNFYPPTEIFIDPEFCTTLTPGQITEGLCEAVKICFAARDDAFDRYMQLVDAADPARNLDTLADIISLSLSTKQVFIEEDEFDRGIRLLLNYGHTLGHPLEGASDFRINHGLAVGVGMITSLHLAGFGHEGGPDRVRRLRAYVSHLLKSNDFLPAELRAVDVERIVAGFTSDKKHTDDHFVVIIPDAEGYLVRSRLPKTEATLATIRAAFVAAFAEIAS